MIRLQCIAVIACFLGFAGPINAQGESPNKFKEKILAQWKSLLEKAKSIQFRSKTETHRSRDNKNYSLVQVDVGQSVYVRDRGILRSTETQVFDPKSTGSKWRASIHIDNQKYTAELKKAGPSKDWLLSDITMNKTDQTFRTNMEMYFPWLVVHDVMIHQWLRREGLIFTKLENLPGDIQRAHFTYSGSISRATDHYSSGYLDFDPQHSYRPVSYEFRTNSEISQGTTGGVLEYEAGDGIPVLVKASSEGKGKVKKKGRFIVHSVKFVTTFSDTKYDAYVDDEVFRLSFYGIPEPDGVTWPKKTRWYLWFIGFAVMSGGVGWYLLRRANNRAGANAPRPGKPASGS